MANKTKKGTNSMRPGFGESSGAVGKAYTEIRKRILDGTYPSSSRITEREIVDVVAVSRTPAREALRRLQAQGLVRVVPNHGAVVATYDESEIEHIYAIRALLEGYAAGLAARRISKSEIMELHALAMKQYEESVARRSNYLDQIFELNSEFHRKLHISSGSTRIVSMLNSVIETPLVLGTISRYSAESLVQSASHHVEIVSALQKRDSEWASAVMRSHIHAAHSALNP